MVQNAPSQALLLADLIGSVKQASGAATQLIHHMQHPGFIMLRDALDLTAEGLTITVNWALTHSGVGVRS